MASPRDDRSAPRAPAWVLGALVVAGVAAGLSVLTVGWAAPSLRAGAVVLALSVAGWGVRVRRPAPPTGWAVVVVGLAGVAAAALTWELPGSGGVVGALGSALALGGTTVALGAVVALAVQGDERERAFARLLDAAVVGSAVAFVLWNLGGELALHAAPPDRTGTAVALVCALATSAVAAACLPMLWRARRGRAAVGLLTGALTALLAADVGYVAGQVTGADVPWVAAAPVALLLGAAATVWASPAVTRVDEDEDVGLTSGRLLLYGLALVLPVAVAGLAAALVPEPRQVSPYDLSAYLLVMGPLVYLRLRLLLHAGRRSEERLRQWFAMPMIGIVVSDPQRRIVDANAELCAMLGHRREDLIGRSTTELTHPDDRAVDAEQLAALLAGDIDSYVVEKRYLRADGSVLVGRNSRRAITDGDGRVEYVIGVVEDVTERTVTAVRHEALVDAAGDTILTVDPEGTLLSFNRAAEEMTGWAAEEVLGTSALRLLEPDERERLMAHIVEVLEEGERVEPLRTRCVRRDGTSVPVEFTVARVPLPDGEVFTAIGRDVSERSRLEAQLTHQALHDPLTGLPNRTLLLDRLGTALARAERSGCWPTLLFIDLDRFKVINDSLGHDVGDELLMVVAHRLSAELRATDTAARLGGDEFVVLCEGLDEADGRALAERLLDAIARPIELDRAETFVTASIGMIVATAGTTADALLRDADASMYRAKGRGGNRLHVFDDSVRAAAMSRLRIESGLRRALAEDELELRYQPQFAVDGLGLVGVEALLRWAHPEQGELEPAAFLGVAAEIGLDVAVDRWVLARAARDGAAWVADAPDLVVWTNLSARSLTEPSLADAVLATLAEAGLAPTNLGLEVTEGALVRDLDQVAATLGRLREAGVRIAIDDFGTGFSSLSWLERLPLDLLKVDRSFTEGLGDADGDTVIVRSIIAMAHNLGLAALAEGVETAGQLAQLRQLGCDQVQGYLLARPLPAAEVRPGAQPVAVDLATASP